MLAAWWWWGGGCYIQLKITFLPDFDIAKAQRVFFNYMKADTVCTHWMFVCKSV